MTRLVTITCPVCKSKCGKPAGHVNRSRKSGAPIYCSKECSGIARRKNITEREKKKRKAAYDREYRAKNSDRIKANKAEYFQKAYDPEDAAVKRAKVKKESPEIEARRREYMASDVYKSRKKKYDRRYRAAVNYGPEWGECMALALDVRDECLSQSSDYEIRLQNGTLSKSQKRKRDYERLNSKEPEIGPLGHIK